jgi:gephyrin
LCSADWYVIDNITSTLCTDSDPVSDTAFKDNSADKSGPTIQATLSERGFECSQLRIVPDEEGDIKRVVREWVSSGEVDLIFTTGGTGFGVRDKTPEVLLHPASRSFHLIYMQAISSLLERPASGIVHLLLSTSLRHTPMAALSRPVAGTIQSTLVVTLPGSKKAVSENMEALLTAGLLDHAVDLIRGGTGKSVHSKMSSTTESSSRHNHHHHHHHQHNIPQPRTLLSHDPTLGRKL